MEHGKDTGRSGLCNPMQVTTPLSLTCENKLGRELSLWFYDPPIPHDTKVPTGNI